MPNMQFAKTDVAKIEKSTLAEINRLYPKGMALDYSPKQIRGVWRIEMKK